MKIYLAGISTIPQMAKNGGQYLESYLYFRNKKKPLSELAVAELVGWFREQGTEDGDIMNLLGYTEEQFKEYSDLFDFSWEEYKVEVEEGDEEEVEEVTDEGDILEEKKLVVTVLVDDYVKIKKRYDDVGKKKFIESLVK